MLAVLLPATNIPWRSSNVKQFRHAPHLALVNGWVRHDSTPACLAYGEHWIHPFDLPPDFGCELYFFMTVSVICVQRGRPVRIWGRVPRKRGVRPNVSTPKAKLTVLKVTDSFCFWGTSGKRRDYKRKKEKTFGSFISVGTSDKGYLRPWTTTLTSGPVLAAIPKVTERAVPEYCWVLILEVSSLHRKIMLNYNP